MYELSTALSTVSQRADDENRNSLLERERERVVDQCIGPAPSISGRPSTVVRTTFTPLVGRWTNRLGYQDRTSLLHVRWIVLQSPSLLLATRRSFTSVSLPPCRYVIHYRFTRRCCIA